MPDRWVNPEGWGPQPPPPQPPPGWGSAPPTRPSGRPRWRRWYLVLPVALVALGGVALGDDTDSGNDTAARPAAPSTTHDVVATVTTTPPSTTTAPPATIPTVKVPTLVGMDLAAARATLADRGLGVTIRYRSTARHPAGTVIAQSRRTGAGVLPKTRITLVIAKAPPPPPTTAPPPSTAPTRDCDPSYPDVCLDPNIEDYDCAGGSGNGPEYVHGPIRVRPPDPFDLDREGDGWGCEAG